MRHGVRFRGPSLTHRTRDALSTAGILLLERSPIPEWNGQVIEYVVILGARDDRYVEVKKGLMPGDKVVTDGKQQVYTKSLLARQSGAALGGHGH